MYFSSRYRGCPWASVNIITSWRKSPFNTFNLRYGSNSFCTHFEEGAKCFIKMEAMVLQMEEGSVTFTVTRNSQWLINQADSP